MSGPLDIPWDDLDRPLALDGAEKRRASSASHLDPELLEGVRRANRNFVIELDACGAIGPKPPIDGARYAAAAIEPLRGDQRRLLAVAICHLDDDGQLAIDLIMRDIALEDIEPELRRYGLDAVSRVDPLDPDVDCAFAQAAATALDELQRSPPPLPTRMRSWRHALVHQRIGELYDGRAKLCRDIGDCPDTVHECIASAIECLEGDDLDGADRWCERAERAIVECRARALGGGA